VAGYLKLSEGRFIFENKQNCVLNYLIFYCVIVKKKGSQMTTLKKKKTKNTI